MEGVGTLQSLTKSWVPLSVLLAGQLLSYEPGGYQRDKKKHELYPSNSSISENMACSSEHVPYAEYQVT